MDDDIESLIRKKALEIWSSSMKTKARREPAEDVVSAIKRIVRGCRAEEIVDKAVRYYGDVAVKVFKQIVDLHRSGAIGELWDYELYEVLKRLGLNVPIETKIVIKRGGREESIGEHITSG